MKQRILFLAANPAGTNALQLDEEARAIEEEIRRSSRRDAFEFVTRWASRPLDLLRALRDVRPTIVHFTGHAATDGICLVDDQGQPAQVTRETLFATFDAAGQFVKVVVLNGCSTELLAQALCEIVPVCVRTSAATRDVAARMFSVGFYGALASGESAARAAGQGRAAMLLGAPGDHDPPQIHHRRDIDPDTLITVAAGTAGSVTAEAAVAASATLPGHAAFQQATAVAGQTAAARHATARNASGTDLIAPLVLLQLSDLHFGPHSRFAGCDLQRLAAQCRQALDEARGDLGWREPVGLVVVTGDVAEAARPPEYATAATFFNALAQQLALLPHRFVFVPGNHDVSWTKCREVEGQLEDGAFPDSDLRARLDAVKLAHFEKFIRDVHGGRAREDVDGASVTSLPHHAFVHDFPDLGVSLAALNSCERESHRKQDHVGAISASQTQAVLDHWRRAPSELIRIVAVHHNPASMASPAIEQWLGFLRASTAQLTPDVVERIATNFVGFDGHEYLRSVAADAHASLILHGHHHASASHQAWAWRGRDSGGAGDARIVSAGSWGLSPESGKLPKDQPVVMQLVRLDPAAAELHAVLLSYNPNARLPGEVRLGRFEPDAQSRADRAIGLSLPSALRGRFATEDRPERGPSLGAILAPRPSALDLTTALTTYRARKTQSFVSWDLRAAGPQPTVGHRPVEITLDDMYIPVRFSPELDPDKLDRGASITADDLLLSRRPQVVVGSAGSGKTTWMRWTFRRLIRDPRALPFFLELRAIAAAWSTRRDSGRSIDSYLADELAACGVSNGDVVVAALLASTTGPHPVLLIDGWDELGAQGERMRERLVEFCGAFPRVTVMVSSRPYGDSRPAGAHAFETVHIQPLSEDDIRLLTTRFHRHIHGLDETAGIHATDEFMAALIAAPGARALAGTALLLTMMLLLSREGPLPDRRHKLYSACLRNMLLHRVTQRERDGAVSDPDLWRPDDSEERLRVAAELAYAMQTEGYKRARRAPIIRTWSGAMELLAAGTANRADPADWTLERCDRFLRWLVATAGVLVDRADGSVHFAHLSFQEHLAAYHLYCTREGSERIAVVDNHMRDRDWWETLRLWAGLTGDKAPDKLSPVLAKLREDDDGYWLAGMIFADGTGQRSDFDLWAAQLAMRLSSLSVWHGEDCARAWGACKQSDRRAALAERLTGARESLRWLEAAWHADWCQYAKLDVDPAPSLLVGDSSVMSAQAVARSRVLIGSQSSWPDSNEIAVLRLWPSTRSRLSVRLQTAVSLGAGKSEIIEMLPLFISQDRRPMSDEDRVHMERLASFFVSDFGEYTDTVSRSVSRRYFGRDVSCNFRRDFANFDQVSTDYNQESVQHPWNFNRSFICDLMWEFGPPSMSVFVDYFTNDAIRSIVRELGWDFVHDLARNYGFSESMIRMPWLPTFVFVEWASCFGRAAPRAALAHGEVLGERPLLALFRAACRVSFAPDDAGLRIASARACDAFKGDPLWSALARHVARISTPDDCALLEDLALHPEQRQPPLSWGIQYYVRGDLMFDDDSVVTLDELCAQAGVAPLPHLEPMPDELDISFDDPSIGPVESPAK